LNDTAGMRNVTPMDDQRWLAERFEEHRGHLRAVAYQMLGSVSEADDAVQDTWLRFSNAGADDVENIRGWLTTIVARVCLNALRARNSRREELFPGHLPDPIVSPDSGGQPEEQVLLADSVGLALLVVLDALSPAERLAFVLHDVFELPFDEVADVVGKTPAATRQLASRARRRVRGADVRVPDSDVSRQRQVIDAFYSAARGGDFDTLVSLLDPEVVLRSDFGVKRPPAPAVIRGADAVARSSLMGAALPSTELHPALINGAAGVVVTARGRPFVIMGFTVVQGRIVEIDVIAGADRVRRLAAPVLNPR